MQPMMPPTSGPVPVAATPAVQSAPADSGRTRLLVAGAVALAVGVVGAFVLWFASNSRYDDAIGNLARAPVGCDTTLGFDDSGPFLVFVETQGTLEILDGDCQQSGEFSSDTTPEVSLELGGPNGEQVVVEPRAGVSYDGDGFVGESIGSVDIAEAGRHILTVTVTEDLAPGDTIAVAIGKDPADAAAALRTLAAAFAIVGLIVGGALFVLAARRPPQPAVPTAPRWPGVDAPPVSSPPGTPVAPPADPWKPASGPPTTLRPPQPPPPTPTDFSPPRHTPGGVGHGTEEATAAPAFWGRPPGPPPSESSSESSSGSPSSPDPVAGPPVRPPREGRSDPAASADDAGWAPPAN